MYSVASEPKDGSGSNPGGSHRQFKHPDRPGRVTVSGKPGHTIPEGTLKSIFKQARWDD